MLRLFRLKSPRRRPGAGTVRRSNHDSFRPHLEALENRCLLTAGVLDPTFGSGGVVVTDLGSNGDLAYDMVIQSDGRIVTGGVKGLDFALVRYNSNGTPDSTFGTNGRAITDFKGGGDQCRALARQTDGKYVAAGYATNAKSGADFGLARYTSNGTLDTSFGSRGKVITSISKDNDSIEAMAIQADGKIVVAGYTEPFNAPGSANFVVARYNPNGTLDTTFGNGGSVVTDFAGSQDHAHGLAIHADGRITVVGKAGNKAGFALAQYNPNGSLNLSFGNQGKVTTALENGGNNYGTAYDVAIQTDGRLVVAGSGAYFWPGDTLARGAMAVARYENNGTLDQGFGTGGIVTITKFGESLTAESLAIQANGKIVVAGDWNFTDFAVARLSGVNGSLDTTFGTYGLATTDIGATFGVANSSDSANTVAIQADGKIVAAGSISILNSTNDWVNDIALARYEGDAALQAESAAATPSAELLTDTKVQPLLSEALIRLQAAGFDVSGLANLDIRIADLGSTTLGLASGNTIWLDDNGAGWGWYVDATPKDDWEFVLSGNQGEQNRMDLLSVVMHELGHILGRAHDADGLMAETLAAGERRTDLEHDHVVLTDEVFAQPDDERPDAWLGIWLTEDLASAQPWAKRRR